MWPKYRYWFSYLKVRGGSLPSNKNCLKRFLGLFIFHHLEFCYQQNGDSLVWFGYGSCVERFQRFRLSFPRVPLLGKGFLGISVELLGPRFCRADLGWIVYLGLANFRKIASEFLSEIWSGFQPPPKYSRPKFTPKIGSIPLLFQVVEPKIISRRFCAYGWDQELY